MFLCGFVFAACVVFIQLFPTVLTPRLQQLVDARDPAANLETADGVIYAVDSQQDEPFAGVFKHMEFLYESTLHSPSNELQVHMKRSPAAREARLQTSTLSGSSIALSSMLSTSGRLESLTVCTTNTPSRGRRNWSVRCVPLHFFTLHITSVFCSRRTDSRAPMVVVLTKSDLLFAQGDERRINRVKAMASNWCTANRSQAFMISCKSGHGCGRAIGSAVQEVILHRRQEAAHAKKLAAQVN